ncbi:hypothetical protein P389DRAFT_57763 [Cystobasidium minutum MCA 4210]|uniref:uncharacterized protein n=1 Tax=Cystobasidium minutum MCA 4210 TaxID=1397322 RepID=UPI0034CF9226|eukprot:jgi/Rhomi1/57763/CE57762_631
MVFALCELCDGCCDGVYGSGRAARASLLWQGWRKVRLPFSAPSQDLLKQTNVTLTLVRWHVSSGYSWKHFASLQPRPLRIQDNAFIQLCRAKEKKTCLGGKGEWQSIAANCKLKSKHLVTMGRRDHNRLSHLLSGLPLKYLGSRKTHTLIGTNHALHVYRALETPSPDRDRSPASVGDAGMVDRRLGCGRAAGMLELSVSIARTAIGPRGPTAAPEGACIV